jgi:hypothetical protein
LRNATNTGAVRLWQHALSCLSQDIQGERWAPIVGIAERIMLERGIEFR